MNKVVLIGRITKDPELRITQSQVNVTSFTIAVDRVTKDAQGNYQTDFIPCVAWRQQAEFLGKYVHKGNKIAVTGTIQIRNYDANDGSKRSVTEVIVDSVENLSPKEEEATSQEGKTTIAPNVKDEDLPF